MTYDAIAILLKAILDGVDDIGIVYKTPQMEDDATKIGAKFLKDGRLNTQWIWRPSIPETSASTGNRIDDFENWEIVLYLTVSEGSESFDLIQKQIDQIRNAIDKRENAPLGASACIIPPSTVASIDEENFMDHLCHIATINLRINNVRQI